MGRVHRDASGLIVLPPHDPHLRRSLNEDEGVRSAIAHEEGNACRPTARLRCKAGFLPARISSVSFLMRSFTHGLRFGFDRSGMRKVGWVPTPARLGTK